MARRADRLRSFKDVQPSLYASRDNFHDVNLIVSAAKPITLSLEEMFSGVIEPRDWAGTSERSLALVDIPGAVGPTRKWTILKYSVGQGRLRLRPLLCPREGSC